MRTATKKTIQTSRPRTVDFDTKDTPINVAGFSEANFYLDCTASSGSSPTLDIDIVTKDPESGTWFILTSFTRLVTTGNEYKIVSSNLGWEIAMDVTITGGTPSFTFSVGMVGKE